MDLDKLPPKINSFPIDAIVLMAELHFKHLKLSSASTRKFIYLQHRVRVLRPEKAQLEKLGSLEIEEYKLVKQIIERCENIPNCTDQELFHIFENHREQCEELWSELKHRKLKLETLKQRLLYFRGIEVHEILKKADEYTRKNLFRNNYEIVDSEKSEQASLITYWEQKSLIPKKANFNSHLYKIMNRISLGFSRLEIIQTALDVNKLLEESESEHGESIYDSNNLAILELIALFCTVARSATDANIEIRQTFGLIASPPHSAFVFDFARPFMRNITDALFFASFFPRSHSEDFDKYLLMSLGVDSPIQDNSRVGVRLREYSSPGSLSRNLNQLDSQEKIHLSKDIDLVDATEVMLNLLRDGYAEDELREFLRFDYSGKQLDLLFTEVRAKAGVIEDQKKILKEGTILSNRKRMKRLNDSEKLSLCEGFCESESAEKEIIEYYLKKSIQEKKWPEKVRERWIDLVDIDVLCEWFEFSLENENCDYLSNIVKRFEIAGEQVQFHEMLSGASSMSNEFVAKVLQIVETDDVDLIFKAASAEKDRDASDTYFDRLKDIYETNPSLEVAEMLVACSTNLSLLRTEILKLIVNEGAESPQYQAAAELGTRALEAGENESARHWVEQFAEENLQCAHVMQLLEPDNPNWTLAMNRNFSEVERTSIQMRFKNTSLSPATQLDDLEFHIGLIKRQFSIDQLQKKRNRLSVPETWICRKMATKAELSSGNYCRFHLRHGEDARKENIFIAGVDRTLNFEVFDLEKAIEKLSNNNQFAVSKPHRWQSSALESWAEHGRHGIIEAVTGSGKSFVGALAISEALAEGFAVIVIVPTRPLGDQWMTSSLESFRQLGILNRLGNTTTDVKLAPISSMARAGFVTVAVMSGELPSYIEGWISRSEPSTKFLLVADEVHHIRGATYLKLLNPRFDRRLGFTATLLRDEYTRSFPKCYFGGDPIYTYDFQSAINDDVIVPFTLLSLGIEETLEFREEYRRNEHILRTTRERIQLITGEIVQNSKFMEYVISIVEDERKDENLRKLANAYLESKEVLDKLKENSYARTAESAIINISPLIKKKKNSAFFCDFRNTADNVKAVLSTVDVDFGYLDGDTLSRERKNLFEKLIQGKLDALIAPKVLDEGIDIPSLEIGIFAGRIRNRRVLTQRLGRILRKFGDVKKKAIAIILYVTETEDDPNMTGNARLELSEFDFVGKNAAGPIGNFVIGRDNAALKEHLNSL